MTTKLPSNLTVGEAMKLLGNPIGGDVPLDVATVAALEQGWFLSQEAAVQFENSVQIAEAKPDNLWFLDEPEFDEDFEINLSSEEIARLSAAPM